MLLFGSRKLSVLLVIRRIKTDYLKTLNNPSFLVSQSEPVIKPTIEFNKINLDNSRKRFLLHDGPPYANGKLHVGHALNKILKDFIIRKKTLLGFSTHFTPGWDCHGSPIELKCIRTTNQDSIRLREDCESYAKKYVSIQHKQFKEWSLFGFDQNLYLTLDPKYQSCQLRAFTELYDKKFVYRSLHPVFWSPVSKLALLNYDLSYRTALSNAELIYQDDHESLSAFIKFELVESEIWPSNTYFVVWTTTPWTLIANQAIALNPTNRTPEFHYWLTFFGEISFF